MKITTKTSLARVAAVASTLLAATAFAAPSAPKAPVFHPLTGDLVRASRARDSILELDLPAGRQALEGIDPNDAALSIERARLLLFSGDYDGAVALLGRGDLAATEEGAELGYISLGCARGMTRTAPHGRR